MSWDDKLFQRHLSTRRFGREYVWLDETDSTNRYLSERHEDFTMTGAVVVAGHQTKGRGRFDRTWHDAPGASLLFSILLRHPHLPEAHSFLTLTPAIALAQVLEARYGQSVGIALKWPNDVLMNGRKVAGILGQTSAQGERAVSIVGMGVNTNFRADALPEDLRSQATSILQESGQTLPREVLLAEILGRWEPLFDHILEGRTGVLREKWEAFGPSCGDPIHRTENDTVLHGTFESLGERGQLIIRDMQGNLHEIFSGDIHS
jgi:BirA family transcriptional regulator, biotin operon repressor / biotin---[acetyl-CoA-carboxylase] ligase